MTLNEIISRILGIDLNNINEELSRDNVESWDSFNHLLLISEIEKEMGIQFTIDEVEKIKTLSELNLLISLKRD